MRTSAWTVLGCLLVVSVLPAWSQGTTFTYQGRLVENGVGVHGSYDMQFSLWDAQPLELRANNQRALRLEGAGAAPNVVG